jgi:Transposase
MPRAVKDLPLIPIVGLQPHSGQKRELQQVGLAQLVQLGQTLSSWRQEKIAMWRFTRNNAITEGFHTKVEVLQRQAYGFRNFQNYRMRVKVLFLDQPGDTSPPFLGRAVEPRKLLRWSSSRAAPCCPDACKSMKTW